MAKSVKVQIEGQVEVLRERKDRGDFYCNIVFMGGGVGFAVSPAMVDKFKLKEGIEGSFFFFGKSNYVKGYNDNPTFTVKVDEFHSFQPQVDLSSKKSA